MAYVGEKRCFQLMGNKSRKVFDIPVLKLYMVDDLIASMALEITIKETLDRCYNDHLLVFEQSIEKVTNVKTKYDRHYI